MAQVNSGLTLQKRLAGVELPILLLLIAQCWDYEHALACRFFSIKDLSSSGPEILNINNGCTHLYMSSTGCCIECLLPHLLMLLA